MTSDHDTSAADCYQDADSSALYQRAQKTLAMGVSSGMRRHVTPTPLYFERADGSHYFDVDGHELIDYTLAWGPLIAGSNHSRINEAITAQLRRGYTYGAQHEAEIELAELMTGVVPGVEQVIYANTGTEAVQAALRIARATTGRTKIVKFEGHYHGWMNNVLVSYHPSGGDPFTAQPTCAGQPPAEYADTIVLPWNDKAALDELFDKRGQEIACVLTEPILANSGSCMPRDGYLANLIDRCRAHGVVSIFDEVITGFRIALGGARERFGLRPDMSVYGKAMAGGFTMAAVGGAAAMFDVLRSGATLHAGTYNGNPVNVAAAIATINALSEPGVYDRIEAHGRALRTSLESAAEKHGISFCTCGVGAVFSAHFGLSDPPQTYRDTLATDMNTYTRFREQMLRRGVHLLPDARWYVGAAHTSDDLDYVTDAIESSMATLT